MKHLVLLLAVYFSCSEARVVEQTKALVGKKALFSTDISLYQQRLKKNLIPKSLLFHLHPKKSLLKSKKKLLQFLIHKSLLTSVIEKKEMAFTPSEKNLSQVILSLKKNLSPKRFSKKLKSVGWSEKSLRQEAQELAQIDFLLGKEVASQILISEPDINAHFFHRYGKSLFKDFKYDLAGVSFSDQKKANNFVKSLSGFSFETLAKKQGLKIKKSFLKEQEMHPQMKKVLKKLSVSQVSPVISIESLFYIFKLVWKEPLLNQKEQLRKKEAEEFLFKEAFRSALKQWLEKQKVLIPIKIL